VRRAEDRLGRVTVESRYHRLPWHLEDHYSMSNEVLGAGANGDVIMATNLHTGAKVAVKVLQLQSLSDRRKRDLLSEVEVSLSLDHPHVARLLEVYESESTLSLVMECMEGGELFNRLIERQRFAEQDAAEASWQILLAVNYLHSEGIVHRDLKLENVLYESEKGDYLKVIDFGFSRRCDRHLKLDKACGTLAYAAPEVLNRNFLPKSDLWSVGVMVFILLAGYMPFPGATDHEKGEAIRQGRYIMKATRWNSISETARDFVQKLLMVCPEQRLDAQGALEHPWIVDRHRDPETVSLRSHCVDERIAESLVSFTRQSRFRRCCLQLMAWCLSREERMEVREAFLELDQRHTGAIKLSELKRTLQERLHMSEEQCSCIAEAFRGLTGLPEGHEGKIHYSDFLAAMMSSRLACHEVLLAETFRRFDVGNCGYLTLSGLHQVLGKTREVDDTFQAVDQDHDGKLSMKDLMSFWYSSDDQTWAPSEGWSSTKKGGAAAVRAAAASRAKSLLRRCGRGRSSSRSTSRAATTRQRQLPQAVATAV